MRPGWLRGATAVLLQQWEHAAARQRQRFLETATVRRAVSALLILTGMATLLWAAIDSVQAAVSRRQHAVVLQRTLATTPAADARTAGVAIGEPIGQLEIGRIDLRAVVVEGDDESILRQSVGHLPDTPLPWHDGNSAFAAHRDGLFRPLRRVRRGDIVQLTTIHGVAKYRVSATHIVEPDDLSVLAPTDTPAITLITCYPFDYIGPAPRRFVVRAERVAPVALLAPAPVLR